jgi:hypothetical protein
MMNNNIIDKVHIAGFLVKYGYAKFLKMIVEEMFDHATIMAEENQNSEMAKKWTIEANRLNVFADSINVELE